MKVGVNPFNENRFKEKSATQVIEAKVVLLGDSGVGKSSIAQRFCRGIFSESHDVTIGGAYLQ
jgi:GTPase SAR1 family protein